MSHIVTIKTHMKDQDALVAACERLGLSQPRKVTKAMPVELYSGMLTSGTAVELEGWDYPVVFNEGTAHYDNYGGKWGDEKRLNELRQAYSVEATTKAAKARGWRVNEQRQQDGSIKLQLQKGWW